MDRKEFITTLGLTAGCGLVINCIGCSKSSAGTNTAAPVNVNFTVDLTDPNNNNLNTNGGSIAINNVIVARTLSGNFLAVQQSCTHQDYPLVYQSSTNVFYCGNHYANFSESGAVVNGPVSVPLQVYRTLLTGTTLKVYS